MRVVADTVGSIVRQADAARRAGPIGAAGCLGSRSGRVVGDWLESGLPRESRRLHALKSMDLTIVECPAISLIGQLHV